MNIFRTPGLNLFDLAPYFSQPPYPLLARNQAHVPPPFPSQSSLISRTATCVRVRGVRVSRGRVVVKVLVKPPWEFGRGTDYPLSPGVPASLKTVSLILTVEVLESRSMTPLLLSLHVR